MAKMPFRASAVLAALCAAAPMAAAAPAHAAPLSLIPGTCLRVHQQFPTAPDGPYLLSGDHKLFTVYCAGMNTAAPKEYVPLARTGTSANFSQYTAGGAAPGTDVRTAFTRLRIDPATFTVDIGDLSYASSTGSLSHSGTPVTSMPYAVAMSCTGSPDGVANVDLRDTAVRVDNPFALGGAGPAGTATASPDGQTVDLTGGGYCGWNMPTPVRYNPINPSPGMPNLKLGCAAQNSVGTSVCIDLGSIAGRTARVERQGDQRTLRLRAGARPIATLDA